MTRVGGVTNMGKSPQKHCSQVGPHLGTLVPMGTKISFLVPIFFQSPHFLHFRPKNASSQCSHYLMSTIWLLVIKKTGFRNFLRDQMGTKSPFGPHFCCRRSPFWQIYFRSPFHVGAVPMSSVEPQRPNLEGSHSRGVYNCTFSAQSSSLESQSNLIYMSISLCGIFIN